MVVTPELRAQILRLYLADQWRIGTIARQSHVHRDTVQSLVCCVHLPTVPIRLIYPIFLS